MNTRSVSLFVFFLAFACWSQNALAQPASKKANATSKIKSQAPVAKQVSKPSKNNQQFSLIQGIWTMGPNENALFTIKGNRVIFFDPGSQADNKNITFVIKDNKISINYGKGLIVTDKIIKLTKDSLVMTSNDGGLTRLGRMK
jgi:hypothetical protein